ncbi:MAG: chitobiase/beta-hexosaminidase C-terminal domain-containing protein [Verrucomicrobiales bacterium]
MSSLIPADSRLLNRLLATTLPLLSLFILPASASPRISEFMAVNDSTILDEDGDSPDWIEIYNPTEDNTWLNLAGYALSDDPLVAQKWLFPTTSIAPGTRIIVFASGKHRSVAGSELHTNFSLDKDGEYLALVEPDGNTILTVFDPYPEQFEGISYGYGTALPPVTSTVIAAGAPCRLIVPGSAIENWQDDSFNDSTWTAANTGIGYERATDGITYTALIGANGNVEAGTFNTNGTCYVRVPLPLTGANTVTSLKLRIKYDDGFIAYLNGTQVASANAPENPAFNSLSTNFHSDSAAIIFQDFDITDSISELNEGNNVLAFHMLNRALDSSDLLMLPELDIVTVNQNGALVEGYYTTPTPNTANGPSVEGFVKDTGFSIDRGFYSDPIAVEITTATPGATILYTTDGSQPTTSNGIVYDAPVQITTTTTLRAAAFLEGYQPTNVDTHTYIYAADVRNQPTAPPGYPATWGSDGGSIVSADYGMDPVVINDPAYSSQIESSLTTTLPVIAISTGRDNLFAINGIYANGRDGSDEIPISLEYFDPDSTDEFQQNAGMRLHGGNARSHPKKPFRFYFRQLYGKGKLRFPLFGDSPVDFFDQLILRPGGHDGWAVPFGNESHELAPHASYIRDQFVRKTETDIGLLSPRGKYVHVYINGLFWGVYDLHERPNAKFFTAHLGGEEEDWDVYHHPTSFGEDYTQVDGTATAYQTLMTLSQSGISTEQDYLDIQEYLDIDGYIDSMITRTWAGDYDWVTPIYMTNSDNPAQEESVGYFDNKNWYCGRKSRNGTGKFHFFAWDAEMCMGNHLLLNVPAPSWLLQNQLPPQRIATFDTSRVGSSGSPAFPYSKLRQYPEFQRRFGDRLHKHLFNDGAMTVTRNTERLDAMTTRIRDAMIVESARWGDVNEGDPLNKALTRNDDWDPEIAWLRDTYLTTRNDFMIERFRAIDLYPAIDAPLFSQHGGSVPSGFNLSISAPAGNIYYTTDGSDPITEDVPAVTTLVLVDEGAVCQVWIPTSGTLGNSWKNTTNPANIAQWTSGVAGIGFDTGSDFDAHVGTDVSGMQNSNASVYIRFPFTINSQEQLDQMTSLSLQMRYDDGFLASINGTRVQVDNALFGASWNSNAIGTQTDAEAVVFREFDISEHINTLQLGPNILAIHGLNSSITGDDLLIEPMLSATLPDTGGNDPPRVILYTGAFPLSQTGTIKARVESGGTWSALTGASFIVGVPADASNLSVSEIHYRPASPDAGEIAAGFTKRGLFEFIEVVNTSTEIIELAGLSFSAGIDFDFNDSTISQLLPGQRLLIVSDQSAFELRYGAGLPIAGSFANATSLNNGGERLTLLDAEGATIFNLRYRDDEPWPEEADGDGYSLVLSANFGNGDPGEGINWRASRDIGGNPGTQDSLSIDTWRSSRFTTVELASPLISGNDADPDEDGLNNLLEYIFGTDPKQANAEPVTLSVEYNPEDAATPGTYQTFALQIATGLDAVDMTLDSSPDLSIWTTGTPGISYDFLGSERHSAETRTLRFRTNQPAQSAATTFYRFSFSLQ